MLTTKHLVTRTFSVTKRRHPPSKCMNTKITTL